MPLDVLPCPNTAKGQSCTPCEDLAPLNQEISEIEKRLATLKVKRRLVYERMNRAHDPLTSKLPAEILSKIFAILLPGNVHGQYNVHFACPKLRQSKFVTTTSFLLGTVCRFWRAIAWSTPQLWTSISVELSSMNITWLKVFCECLLRSGQLPLYISLEGDFQIEIPKAIADQFFEQVNSYSERWFDLDLQLPAKLLSCLHSDSENDIMLNTLSVQSYSYQGIELNLGRAFNLRNLYMRHLHIDGYNLAWQNLTNVNVGTRESIDLCFELFSKASSMTHCRFQLETDAYNSHTTRNTILRHDHLIFLSVYYGSISASMDIFFSWVELPALEHFVIDGACNDIDPRALQHLLSSCSLKTFKVKLPDSEPHFCERTIIPLLEAMSSLETLEVIGGYRTTADPLLIKLSKTTSTTEKSPSHDMTLLPNLRSLLLEYMILSWTCLHDAVFAHSGDATIAIPAGAESGVESEMHQYIRPLCSLYIQLPTPPHGCKWQPMEPDIAQKIQRAIEHGFKVAIVVPYYWDYQYWGSENFLAESLQPKSLSGIWYIPLDMSEADIFNLGTT